MIRTPIYKIYNNIYIKRDDLLPCSFGGNKYRIATEFITDMKKQGKNCIVGYGNARSNLSRALSALCAAEGIPCYLVSPSDDDGTRKTTFNSLLCDVSDAKFIYCSKSNVADTIENTIEECKAVGFNPYYINGDKFGKGNEKIPVNAYVNVFKEICDEDIFDYIFLPTGTGMTQSGLIVGSVLEKKTTKIVGISVARLKEQETKVISEFILAYLGRHVADEQITVVDDYLCGGYGKSTDEIDNLILDVYRKYGIPLDPTYTGKAFYGMLDYIDQYKLHDKKCLFIHTGGTPLFFDFMKNKSNHIAVEEVYEQEDLINFLQEIDLYLPTPLSLRVDLNFYADKVFKNGRVLGIRKGGSICSAILFYCNDKIDKDAYLTLIGTTQGNGGNGYAEKLIREASKICIENGMERFKLETDFENSRAIALYSRLGFKIDYVNEKIHMVKELCK